MPQLLETKIVPPMMPSTVPQPGLRRGPRPLMMHLALAMLKSNGSNGAWPSSSEDWQALMTRLTPTTRPDLALAPDAALVHGIAAYRRHPYVRNLTDPAPVWQEGASRLLDFGGATDAPPLLIVPSLINRATILDLSQGHSMARGLAASGLRVFVLDWGWPGEIERKLGLDELIAGRLARAIEHVGLPVTLVGYCMGGLLTLAACQLQPDRVAKLALLATPWDFHAGRADAQVEMTKALAAMEPVMNATGTLPIDALQMLFSIGDPHAVGDKYRAFGQSDQDTDRARQFVAIEDWLNDGVPLAAPVARACLRDWYGENLPMRGQWKVAGSVIDPAEITVPTFLAIPGRDRIVPPESASPLARILRKPLVVRPSAGHVGMVAGATAETSLWAPLAKWARQPAVRLSKGRRAV